MLRSISQLLSALSLMLLMTSAGCVMDAEEDLSGSLESQTCSGDEDCEDDGGEDGDRDDDEGEEGGEDGDRDDDEGEEGGEDGDLDDDEGEEDHAQDGDDQDGDEESAPPQPETDE